MLYAHARTLPQMIANAAALLLVGALLVATGLNAASGCGDGGECIGFADFTPAPTPEPHRTDETLLARLR